MQRAASSPQPSPPSDGGEGEKADGAIEANSFCYFNFPKISFASASVSFEPMSNHSPGTRQV